MKKDYLTKATLTEHEAFVTDDVSITLRDGTRVVVRMYTRQLTNYPQLPRLKVGVSGQCHFVMTIDSTAPAITVGTPKCPTEQIAEWIMTNYTVLMKYWNEEYTEDVRVFDRALTPLA